MRYFPSGRDWWFGLITWGLIPGMLVAIILLALLSPPEEGLVVALTWVLPVCLTLALQLWLWYTTGYTFTEKELLVRAAFLTYRIPFSAITRVRPTRSLLSSPALSLNRLEVRWGKRGSVLISPAERDAFIELLRERCPQAEIRG